MVAESTGTPLDGNVGYSVIGKHGLCRLHTGNTADISDFRHLGIRALNIDLRNKSDNHRRNNKQ